MFVDDLKLYAKSENKISVVTKTVKEMYEDIGMSWGLERCASLYVVRGKISKSEDLPIGWKTTSQSWMSVTGINSLGSMRIRTTRQVHVPKS